jgi:hypothetical protein
MSRHGSRCIALISILTVGFAFVSVQAAPRPKKGEQAAPAPTPGDRRDRVVNAPGTPFHGRAFWQAAAQCGGIYFKLGTQYSEQAISAKVIKPDPAAYTRLTREADAASAAATRFFEASENFLLADRKLPREEAVLTYDPVAAREGERFKSVDAALQATKPCADFYKSCRGAHPQMCSDPMALTN